MNKKGVEMSLQTVMIAVLALLVLGVLIYLVITGVIRWGSGTDCMPSHGTCVDVTGSCPSLTDIKSSAFKCGTNQVCCTPLTNQNG